MTKDDLNRISYEILGAVIEVHKELGPGLLENVYSKCLAKELELRNIQFQTELSVPVSYKNYNLETNLRCDFLVSNNIVLEIKSVSEMNPIFEAQILTYMKLLKVPKGILINFNCKNIFHEGQKTFVNSYFKELIEF